MTQTHEEMCKVIVGEVNGRPVTQGELMMAFNKVKSKSHWKNPINCSVNLTDDEIKMVTEAVIFFTGSVPSFSQLKNGKVRVRAAGYFNAIGA